jgi:lactate dehydrogenase-like 2-hydroxyacid dehydrogenase
MGSPDNIGGALLMLAAGLAVIYVPVGTLPPYSVALVLGIASRAAMIPFSMMKEVGTKHTLHYLELPSTARTAVLAKGSKPVGAFVNDQVDADVLEEFKRLGIGLVALRAASFNTVDRPAAKRLGIAIARVPAYSPDAVAEHAVALILSLNRKTHLAYARLREGNFALDGLLGFNLAGRTVGIIGTGKIGSCVAKIMSGFGSTVLAYDLAPNPDQAMHLPLSPRWAMPAPNRDRHAIGYRNL